MFVAILFNATSLAAQVFRPSPSVQLRLGAFAATPLVSDAAYTTGTSGYEITVKQRPGLVGTLALRLPLQSATQIELNASAGESMVRSSDGISTWDGGNTSFAALTATFGYLYHRALALRLGIGATRLFGDDDAGWLRGNSLQPLVEAGLGTTIQTGGLPIDFDVRAQAHRWGTTGLSEGGGRDGTVVRGIVQIGTTLWSAKK